MKQSEEDVAESPKIKGFSAAEVEFLHRNLPDGQAESLRNALPLLAAHLDELSVWAPRLNLVAAGTRMEWLRRHFLDSLLAAAPLQTHCNGPVRCLVDIGSGAGFPGLPLAAMLRPQRTVLIEPRQRRAHFLRAVARRSPVTGLEIANVRVENFMEPIAQAVVVSRATFSDLAALLNGCLPWLGVGSIAMALCAPSASSPDTELVREHYEELAPVHYKLPESSKTHELRFWRRQA